MGEKFEAPPCSILRFTFLLFLGFLICVPLSSVTAQCKKNPVIFSFGDSNTDTGGLAAALGYDIKPPNGRTFFHKSTGRLSDGRLVIDFLCQSLNTSYLNPYLDSLRANFTNGANFAIVGSATLPKFVPFSLNIQVLQFSHFKSRLLENTAGGARGFIDEDGFRNALYMIDIGQNDLSDSFAKNLSYAHVVQLIPSFLAEIKQAVETLYGQGARNFWIHNTGPLGCLPQKLALDHHQSGLDQDGCIRSHNAAARLFNEGLRNLCQEMRSELQKSNIIYVDIYSIKHDLIANYSKYGFDHPLMACCGYGGPPYNYNINITCGNNYCQVCNEGSGYISWDGIHYTEAANTIIASKILSTTYSTPPMKFDFFCLT